MNLFNSCIDRATCCLWGAFVPEKRDAELSVIGCVKARVHRTALVFFAFATAGIPHFFTYLYLGRKIKEASVKQNPALERIGKALYNPPLPTVVIPDPASVVPTTPAPTPLPVLPTTPAPTPLPVLPTTPAPVVSAKKAHKIAQHTQTGTLLGHRTSNLSFQSSSDECFTFDFYINLIKALRSDENVSSEFKHIAEGFKKVYRGGIANLLSDDISTSASLLFILLERTDCKTKSEPRRLVHRHIKEVLIVPELKEEMLEKYHRLNKSFNKGSEGSEALYSFLVTLDRVVLDYLSSDFPTPIITPKDRHAMFLRALIQHPIKQIASTRSARKSRLKKSASLKRRGRTF